MPSPTWPFDFEFASATQAIVVWFGFALLAILILLRRPASLLLVHNEKGRLRISRHAMHRLIETSCEQVGGVASARARIQRRGGVFRTRLRLKLRPEAKVDALHGYLTQEITTLYKQNLGIQNIGPIEIEITGYLRSGTQFDEIKG